MTTASDERALAALLSARDVDELAATLAVRHVRPDVSWRDCFDAAQALLAEASVDDALRRLDRTTLHGLWSAVTASSPLSGDVAHTARLWALADGDGRPLAAVRTRLRALHDEEPGVLAAAPEATDPPESDESGTAEAAQRAAATTRAVTDLVARSRQHPVRTTAAGAVTAADRAALIDVGIAADGTHLDDLLALGTSARLLARTGREYVVTDHGDTWLPTDADARWSVLARGWRDGLPAVMRTPGGGVHAPAAWAGLVPLDPDWPDRAAALRRRAQLLGLFTPGGAQTPWARALRAGAAPDASTLSAAVPPEIDRVYLQADLTAVAPGPLRSAIDLRLRTIADRESHAVASTYRFSARTLAAGLAAGQTAADIRAFLADLSLSGIPQPLDYLITQAGARHGLVTVRSDRESGRTVVESSDAALLHTIGADRSLRVLGLMPQDGRLVSRGDRETVRGMLAEARYPVSAVGDDGRPLPVQARRVPTPTPDDDDPLAALRPLAAHLREHSGGDAETVWLARELEQAVHERRTLAVTVRMPDGSERVLTMEVTGLRAGRLRGRDHAGDVERTLPVRSISSVRTVD